MKTPEQVKQLIAELLHITTDGEFAVDNAVTTVGIDEALQFLSENRVDIKVVDDETRQLVRRSHARSSFSPTQVGIILQLEGELSIQSSGHRFNLNDLLIYQVETNRGDDIGMVRICRRSTLE